MSKAKTDEWLHSDLGSPWRQHRDDGGGLGADPSVGTGISNPSAGAMNPIVQSAIQHYAGLPTAQLAVLASKLGPSKQGQLAQQVLQQKRMMPVPQAPITQAQTGPANIPGAAGIPSASTPVVPPPQYRKGGPIKRDMGGSLSPSQMAPWWTRQEARGADSGFLHGTTPGRADSVLTTAPGGSYVLPADVIAGLGEGNSLAGARVADAMFSTGPKGIPLPRGRSGMGPPRPPQAFREEAKDGGPIKLFKGGAGGAKKGTDVALSHGEYVISPEKCAEIGGGDAKAGHRIIDKWVVEQRAKQVKKIKSLPGPVQT